MSLPCRDASALVADLSRRYSKLFSSEERDFVTLRPIKTQYPFQFNREELAVFYRASRLLVHFPDKETRCRVAAYA